MVLGSAVVTVKFISNLFSVRNKIHCNETRNKVVLDNIRGLLINFHNGQLFCVIYAITTTKLKERTSV